MAMPDNRCTRACSTLFTSEGSALKLPGLHLVFSVSPYMLQQNNQLPTLLRTGGVVSMP